jgi:hypothetical protein
MALLVGRDGLELDDVRLRKGAWFTLMFDGPPLRGGGPSPPFPRT